MNSSQASRLPGGCRDLVFVDSVLKRKIGKVLGF